MSVDVNLNLYKRAEACLLCSPVNEKTDCVRQLVTDWHAGNLNREAITVRSIPEPGRPAVPRMVQPRDLPRRKIGSTEGHAALIHSICHIEFNAINLALDAVYRFHQMPDAFYRDWLQVAKEEAYHFQLLEKHLRGLGYAYGDFSAHNGLWEMTLETAHDPMVRMALVPRVLEARGLDVTPGIMEKLESIGDHGAVDILTVIQHDEVGHVETGSRWFQYLCDQRGLDAETEFKTLLGSYMKGPIRGPLDRQARLQAGFSEAELDYLEGAV